MSLGILWIKGIYTNIIYFVCLNWTSYFSEYAEIIPGTFLLAVASIFLNRSSVSIAHCVIVEFPHINEGSLPYRDEDKQYNTCPVLFDSDVEFQESKTLSWTMIW